MIPEKLDYIQSFRDRNLLVREAFKSRKDKRDWDKLTNYATVRLTIGGKPVLMPAKSAGEGPHKHAERMALLYTIIAAVEKGLLPRLYGKRKPSDPGSLLKMYKKELSNIDKIEIFTERTPCTLKNNENPCLLFLSRFLGNNCQVYYAIKSDLQLEEVLEKAKKIDKEELEEAEEIVNEESSKEELEEEAVKKPSAPQKRKQPATASSKSSVPSSSSSSSSDFDASTAPSSAKKSKTIPPALPPKKPAPTASSKPSVSSSSSSPPTDMLFEYSAAAIATPPPLSSETTTKKRKLNPHKVRKN